MGNFQPLDKGPQKKRTLRKSASLEAIYQADSFSTPIPKYFSYSKDNLPPLIVLIVFLLV
jgi:hypothetical protein